MRKNGSASGKEGVSEPERRWGSGLAGVGVRESVRRFANEEVLDG